MLKKQALSLTEFYMKKNKTTRPESEHLKKLAGKITKVPDTIHIPAEYLVKRRK